MPRSVKTSGPERGYHHGDLPAVLTDTAIELIREQGVHGFSLAEAARRAGVSVGAPYRHFPDKESLLAAVGVRAHQVLRPRLDAAIAGQSDPAAQLSAAAAAYVRFSVDEPALFSALFRAEVTKSRFPALAEAALQSYGTWLAAARALAARPDGDADEEAARDLAVDVLTVAHGHAALLADGQFGSTDEDADAVVARVRRVTATLLRGRGPATAGSP
ncbi:MULTISPECIES: TetR/AcrR family transcriptional regulator [unclassified Geodermatophilus]